MYKKQLSISSMETTESSVSRSCPPMGAYSVFSFFACTSFASVRGYN